MTKEEFTDRIQKHKKSNPWFKDPIQWIEFADEYQEHNSKLAAICRRMADLQKQYINQIDMILDQLSFETEIEDEQEVSDLLAKFSKGINQ